MSQIWNNEWIKCRMCLEYANCIHCKQRNLKESSAPPVITFRRMKLCNKNMVSETLIINIYIYNCYV